MCSPFSARQLQLYLLRPNHEREHLVPPAEVEFVQRGPATMGRPDQRAPLRRRGEVDVGHRRRHRAERGRAERGRAVEVCIDELQLLIVVRIRVLVRARVIRIIHTASEVRVVEVRVLVIEAEGVPDLLAHHEIPPRRGVVRRGVEVRVVHLDYPLGDMAATEPDLRQPEPAIGTVLAVADLHAPAGRSATFRGVEPATIVVSSTVDWLQSVDVVARDESQTEDTLSPSLRVKGLLVRAQW